MLAALDRQHCAVHRLRNLLAKLPKRERERVRQAYWQRSTTPPASNDGKQRLQALIDELEQPATTPPPAASPTTSTRSSCTCATRSATADGGAARTCSSGHSARSADAPR